MTTSTTCLMPASLMDASFLRLVKPTHCGIGNLDRLQINRKAKLIADAMGKGFMVLDDRRFVDFVRKTYTQNGAEVLEEVFCTANHLMTGKLTFFPCVSEAANGADAAYFQQLGELIYEFEDMEFATKIFQP